MISATYNACQQKKADSYHKILDISSGSIIQIVNIFLCLRQKYGNSVYPSQTLLAKQTGLSRRQVIRITHYLHEEGIIIKRKRYNDTSEYIPSSIFTTHAHLLKSKFSALKHVLNKFFLSSLFVACKTNFKANVTSSLNNIYKYPVYILTRERYVPEPTYIPKDREFLHTFYNRKKGRKNMIPFVPSDTVQQLTKKHNLSKWGQLKLSIFPDFILKQVDNSYNKLTKTPDNPFEWFFLAAKTICETNCVDINWQSFYDYKEFYKMPDNALMVLPNICKTTSYTVPSDNYLATRDKDQERNQERRNRISSNPQLSAMQQMFQSMLSL